VKWENTTNEVVLERAREAIRKSWRETCEANKDHPRAAELFDPEKLPAFHDPFAGGGAIPLEAQRLGLEAYASDLNPVAVLINKAMIEIPPKFAGRKPVGPIPKGEKQPRLHQDWPGATGLAEDVRRHGRWMRDEAEKRIGHLYPKVEVTAEMARERPDLKKYVGKKLTVIAWLWARTVKSPNLAFAHVDVPLASTFMFSTKAGKEAYVEPVIEGGGYRFTVKVGKPKDAEAAKAGTKLARGANFRCVMSGTPIAGDYIKAEGKAGRMGARLMAIVGEGDRGRVYLAPMPEHEAAAGKAKPAWRPEGDVPARLTGGTCVPYGLATWGDLFTPRQLVALTIYSDLVGEAMERVKRDAVAAGMADDGTPLRDGGTGAAAYAEAVGVYLALGVDKATDYNTTLVAWSPTRDQAKSTFARQALPMVWDYAEVNQLAGAAGDFIVSVEGGIRFLNGCGPDTSGISQQANATAQTGSVSRAISTDPPYYDNIGYADLSDFFYVWLRRSLRTVFPDLFATLAVPKAEELVATPYRHGSKDKAEAFFLAGMTLAMHRLAEQAHPGLPVTIYYAFKQSETESDAGTSSTGWETFLDAVIRAGFGISGTWPMRTERGARSISIGTNALASSIVLVCRKRDPKAATISRRDFQRELRDEMPEALETMIGGKGGASPIAPVDLAQAAIGPGMAIFSRYAAVLEADGSPMSVHNALVMINKEVDEFLNPSGAGFDADTQFCSAWFAQLGWATGKFGEADVLARAKGTSVDGVAESRVIQSGGGKVRLLKWEEYPDGWDPTQDNRTPVWEACHHLIRALNRQGESEAGRLLARMPERAEPIRQLAYHLYTVCERKKWADDARAYNELITAWHGIMAASHAVGHVGSQVELGL
jgi:putative DNA methylase